MRYRPRVARALLGLAVFLLGSSLAATGQERSVLPASPTKLPHAGDLSGVAVDLSSHASKVEITSQSMQDAQIDLIIHRLTIGRYPGKDIQNGHDALYLTRFNEVAKARGTFGAYHVLFPSPSGIENGREQAKGFLTAVSDFCPRDQRVLLAVDWESVSCRQNGRWKKCGTPDPSYIYSFVHYVTAVTNKQLLIYTFGQVLKTYSSELSKNNADNKLLTSQPLWFAQPWRRFKTALETKYRVGNFFPSPLDFRPWRDWTFWQLNAAEDKTQVRPTQAISMTIGGQPADFNWFNGGRRDFAQFYRSTSVSCKSLPATPP